MFKQNPYIFLFRRMRKYAPSKKLLFRMLFFSTLSKLVRLLQPWIFGKIINTIQLKGFAGRGEIEMYLLAGVGITIVGGIFLRRSRVWEEKIRFDVGQEFATDMFRKVTSLPMQWHNDHHSGETIDKINKGMYAIKEFSGNNHMYLNTVVYSVGSLISIALLWRKAAVILVVFGGIMFFIVRKFDKYLVPLIKIQNKKEHIVMSTLFDLLSNIKTVITLRFESRALIAVKDKIKGIFPFLWKYTVSNEWKRFIMDSLLAIITVVIIGLYTYEQFTLTGTILIGTFTMLYQYAMKMNDALINFTWQYSGIVVYKADMEAVANIEEAYDSIIKVSTGDIEHRRNIEVDKLHFKYEDMKHKQHTLEDIRILLAPGKRIALVGESGSGKSTLLSLLRGLFDVDSVMLSIDAKRFDTLHPLASITSLIPQEPEIFDQTIKNNLTMGLDISEEKLREVLKVACADDVVSALPNKLDTDLKEKGVNLSGGQKQRIALARGLLMAEQSSILLLDEPTSSVDGVNEMKIYQRLFKYYPEKCLICSIHKLHLVDQFDEVYVLDDGKLVERGSPAELLALNGRYAAMYKQMAH